MSDYRKQFTLTMEDITPSMTWEALAAFLRAAGFGVTVNDVKRDEERHGSAKVTPEFTFPPGDVLTLVITSDVGIRRLQAAIDQGVPFKLDVPDTLRKALAMEASMKAMPDHEAIDRVAKAMGMGATAGKALPRHVAMRMRLREAIESAFPFDPYKAPTEDEKTLKRIVLLAAELPFVPEPAPEPRTMDQMERALVPTEDEHHPEERNRQQARQELARELREASGAMPSVSMAKAIRALVSAIDSGII